MHIDDKVPINNNTEVCENHFLQNDIIRCPSNENWCQSKLKKGAIPTDNSLLSSLFSEDSIRLLNYEIDEETIQHQSEKVYFYHKL